MKWFFGHSLFRLWWLNLTLLPLSFWLFLPFTHHFQKKCDCCFGGRRKTHFWGDNTKINKCQSLLLVGRGIFMDVSKEKIPLPPVSPRLYHLLGTKQGKAGFEYQVFEFLRSASRFEYSFWIPKVVHIFFPLQSGLSRLFSHLSLVGFLWYLWVLFVPFSAFCGQVFPTFFASLSFLCWAKVFLLIMLASHFVCLC